MIAGRGSPLAQKAAVATIPPLVRGWNRRDPLANMKPGDTVVLDNLIPRSSGVETRPGRTIQVSGASFESLMEFAPPNSANRKLFGATANAIYDVTTAGALGAPVVSGLTSGRWQHTMFSTPGGNFLVACNGADAMRYSDGTTWVAPGVTGVSASALVNVTAHKQRLWFVENNSLRAWYLPTASIAGSLTSFDVGAFCRLGGQLLAMATVTRDGGDGMDDLLAFITSRGEVLLYAGTDPASAATWGLVGIFRIAEPIGRRCVLKIGADVAVITSQGLIMLSSILALGRSEALAATLTNRIDGAFEQSYAAVGANFGWQIAEYPKQGLVLVNVPVLEGSEQYVMNATTGSWCRFTGWSDVTCMSLLGDSLYLGGTNGVYLVSDAYTDDGAAITMRAQTAFDRLGGANRKRFLMVRPVMYGPPGQNPGTQVVVDYNTQAISLSTPTFVQVGAEWDLYPWDELPWDGTRQPIVDWLSSAGIGTAVSVAVGLAFSDKIELNQIDVMFERGGLL